MAVALSIVPDARRLKSTTSRCPVCLSPIPAEVVEVSGRVVMRKSCPEHGGFETVIAGHRRFYHESAGAGACGPGCGCGTEAAGTGAVAASGADPFETLSTCVALIEIVDSCNLKCPTCFAASPWGVGGDVDCTPFDEFVGRVAGVIARKGFVDVLQLSGGEPTIHPEFFRLLDWALAQDKIGYVLINTNGVRIAQDHAFRERLAESRRRLGKFELYVQFDGVQEEGQRELRGADLREVRRRAIDDAGALGVPTTLAMTVTPETIGHLGDTVRFGLERKHCRGVTFQPMFNSGRTPNVESSLPVGRVLPTPVTVGDVIVNLVGQSEGLLTEDDFTPLPCGDPNCHTIGYLLRKDSGTVGLSKLVDLGAMQGFLKDRLDYRLEDLARCGCESEPLGEVIKGLEVGPEAPFRVFIKPFMDAWTFDQDRIDRCCTHVIRKDGKLDSFCRYYLMGGAGGETNGKLANQPAAAGELRSKLEQEGGGVL